MKTTGYKLLHYEPELDDGLAAAYWVAARNDCSHISGSGLTADTAIQQCEANIEEDGEAVRTPES